MAKNVGGTFIFRQDILSKPKQIKSTHKIMTVRSLNLNKKKIKYKIRISIVWTRYPQKCAVLTNPEGPLGSVYRNLAGMLESASQYLVFLKFSTDLQLWCEFLLFS